MTHRGHLELSPMALPDAVIALLNRLSLLRHSLCSTLLQ